MHARFARFIAFHLNWDSLHWQHANSIACVLLKFNRVLADKSTNMHQDYLCFFQTPFNNGDTSSKSRILSLRATDGNLGHQVEWCVLTYENMHRAFYLHHQAILYDVACSIHRGFLQLDTCTVLKGLPKPLDLH
jgi:hypothetical protein